MTPDFSNKRPIIDSVLYMLFIFIISSISYPSEKIFISWEMQNVLHIPLYGVLAFLWMRAFYYNKAGFRDAVMYTFIIAVLYAVFDEYHQSFVPGRDASAADVLFDVIGSVAGIFIYRYRKK
ncbi:VanZ family protein [Omnitrophica bacterium]|nr:VanZ family protein [Candidatus Omnitrophota bacterium]